MALASRSKANPFPVIPPRLSAPSPSQELLELRAEAEELEARLKTFVGYLVDMEHSETPRRYSPSQYAAAVPEHLASLPSSELEEMRDDCASAHFDLSECVAELRAAEEREAVVDLTGEGM